LLSKLPANFFTAAIGKKTEAKTGNKNKTIITLNHALLLHDGKKKKGASFYATADKASARATRAKFYGAKGSASKANCKTANHKNANTPSASQGNSNASIKKKASKIHSKILAGN
jgi:hypothetical protein